MNPNGVTATAWFEYGLSATYGSSTASQTLAAGTTAVAVSAIVSSLSVNTTYHFRIDAANNGGTIYGLDAIFTTLANAPTVTTSPAASISQTGATLNGTVNPNGVTATAWFEYGLSATYGSSTAAQNLTAGTTPVAVSAVISGLTAGTIYHFRIDATNSGGPSYGSDITFTTLANPPIVTTGVATNISQTSATLNATVNPNGVPATAWFEWGTTTSYGSSNASAPQSIPAGTTAVSLTPVLISGLLANTVYHYHVVANNTGGTSYGTDATFTTLSNPPVVTTGFATTIVQTSATLNGTVNPNGVSALAWFEWGLSAVYGSSNASSPQSIPTGTTAVSYSLIITGLTANTTYHFRADASNTGGTGYGTDNLFTTLANPPVVTTLAASNMGQFTTTLNGSVNPNGVSATTWFQWGLTTSYGSSNASSPQSIPAGTSAVSYFLNISGLSANTTYHYQAIALNNGGTTYGSDITFTTLPNPPIVTTGAPPANITQTSAVVTGTVNPNGQSATAWFEWGLTTTYGSSNANAPQSIPATTSTVTLNPFTMTGLTANTTYHYRADAQSSGGTGYGQDASFTTLASPPVVVTGSPATNILQNSATLNGTANSNGVNGVAWFDYGLTTSYNLSSQTQAISGNGANSVVISVFSLTANTTYHYRISATNNGGTTYGADATFTTLPNPPIVTTGSPATNITQTSGTVSGTVNPNGQATTAWFEWGLSSAYGSSNAGSPQSISSGTTAVNLTPYTITGLTAYTTYHYRADANNAGGTSYGVDASFTTLPLPPAVTTLSATAIFQTTATLNGTVNPNMAPGTAFFNYGLTTAYGSASTTVSISGSADMTVSILVGNLTALTTYHFQLVAYNAGGTSYGQDAAFTTLAFPPDVITDYASNVSVNSAVLNGEVNPNGLTANAWFEWGVTTTYGSSNMSTPQLINPGTTYVIMTPLSIGSLSPNTNYHFRAVAQSSGGKTTGVDRTFTTLSGGVSPPGLSFSSDPGYNSVLGYTGTNPYTFKVDYTSPNNLTPTMISLFLDGDRSGLPMTLDNTPMGTFTSATGGPVINNSPVTDGIVGTAYSQTFSATGGTLPYTWSVTGTLPGGLTLTTDPVTGGGILSGTPGTSGTYPLTITATDANNISGSVDINLIICSYTTGCQYRVTPPAFLAGVGYYYFGASDGSSTISLSSSGTLTGPTVSGTSTATPVGNNVMVTPAPAYAVSFASVNSAGNTTVSTSSTVPAIPASYTAPLTNIYQTDISTTALYTGNITICINYNSAYFINQNAIVMLHYDAVQAKWVNVTASLDVIHNIVCGITSSLSPFALMMTGSTAVGLTSFNTIAGDGNVMVEWTTETETHQLGFNILRALSVDGPFTQINGQMIPARGNSIYGSRYRFMDYGVTNGLTYYYKLESVDTGNRTLIQFVSIANPHALDSSVEPAAGSSSNSNQKDQSGSIAQGTGLLIAPSIETGQENKNPVNVEKGEENKSRDLPVIPVSGQFKEDRVILSWIPMDSNDSYTIWRSEEKNGFYKIVNDRLVAPEVRGNMDENDYLIRCVYEDKAVESGKTYYYKIERMMPGSDGKIVGSLSVKTEEIKKSNKKEAVGVQLDEPVIIEHQKNKEAGEDKAGTH
ncbi:MAG: beta strand repeat-containing protein [Nitrospiria bacterium]